MSALRKNVASQHIGFVLNSTAAGAPVTAGGAGTVVIDGGAQAACAGTFTHKGTGQWDYAPTQAETNGTSIHFAFTGTGAVQVGMQFFTLNYDTTATAVPANATQWLGGTIPAVNVTGVPLVDLKYTLGTISPATAGSVRADAVTAGVTVTTNNDKTGYALTQTFPTNFSSTSIDASGRVDVGKVNGNANAAINVSKANQALVRGVCSGGTTTTAVCSSITTPAALTDVGQLIGRTIVFDSDTTTASLRGQASNITASTTGATPTITFSPMTNSPVNGDTFTIA